MTPTLYIWPRVQLYLYMNTVIYCLSSPSFQPLVDLRGHLDRLVEKEGDGFLAIIILDDRGAVPDDLYTVLLIPIVARPLSQIGTLPVGVREDDEVGPVASSAWATRASSGSAASTHQ